MDRVLELAAKWGIEAAHYDGLGRHWQVIHRCWRRILEAIRRTREKSAPPEAAAEHVTPAFQAINTLPRRSWGIEFSSMAFARTGIGERRFHRSCQPDRHRGRAWRFGDWAQIRCMCCSMSGPKKRALFPSSRLFLIRSISTSKAIPNFPAPRWRI